VLLSLAVTSIIGTVIPQNENPAAYVREYGEFLYRFFSVLDVFDMYHSWWFQILLIMVTLNIFVCSVDRLSATWKIIFAKNPSFNTARFRRLTDREEFIADGLPDQLKGSYESVAARGFSYKRVETTEKGFCVFAEKGRWTRLGVYGVHLSVIFLLLGGLIGSVFGFDGFVNIPEGESVKSIRIRNSGQIHPLDFEILCRDFFVSFYDNGTPKEFRSSLTIVENGQPVFEKDIIVNDPLRYRGINLFQSSYGALPPKSITLSFTSSESSMVYKKKAVIGQPIDIPEGGGTFVFKNFDPSYNFRGHSIGETAIATLTPAEGKPIEVILPLRFPSFDKMRKGQMSIAVVEYDERYYTGLQVTRDPGVWVVYTGFILMIIGCTVTFFMSHQQLCVEVLQNGNKSRVMVAGKANKNKMGMQRKVAKISKRLARSDH
jgi:cytochrome c biogenesis protein